MNFGVHFDTSTSAHSKTDFARPKLSHVGSWNVDNGLGGGKNAYVLCILLHVSNYIICRLNHSNETVEYEKQHGISNTITEMAELSVR